VEVALHAQSRLPGQADPTQAWLVPRLEMSFRAATAPIDTPVYKLGGQPVWLEEPFWPVSRSFGTEMTFVGQFPIPGDRRKLSYLFVAEDDLCIAETFEPARGEHRPVALAPRLGVE
jgi:hypothetical protein